MCTNDEINRISFEYPYSDTQHFIDVDGVPKKVMDFLTVKHYRPSEKELLSKNVGVKVTTLAKNDPICEQNALIELQNLLQELLNRYPTTIKVIFAGSRTYRSRKTLSC